jgi:hypothetical protein
MIFLRQTPFPLELSYEGLEPEKEYSVEIYNDNSFRIASYLVESDANGRIKKDLDKYFEKFDEEYALYVYSLDQEGKPKDTVVMDTLTIKRPYVNPLSIGNTQDEDHKAIYNERIARSIIDSVTGGFYYKQKALSLVGLGGDYLPISNRINKVSSVYKNNQKVYDQSEFESGKQDEYIVTVDNSAITVKKEGIYNRSQHNPVGLPIASSDSYNLYNNYDDPIAALTKVREADLFPKGYDFDILGEFGWPVVPQDIQEAARMLIEDIECENSAYISKYITEYRTDQFTIKYGDRAWQGTGNRMVDQILSNHQERFYNIGVL